MFPILHALNETQNVLRPAGVQAAHIGELWNLTMVVCGFAFAAILAAFLVALYQGAHRPQAKPYEATDVSSEPPLFKSIAAAVALTIALLFVLIIADFFTSRALARMPVDDAVQIEMTGHQWWWEAQYTHDDPSKNFSIANELHIPVGKPVVITLHSADVIHSFWAPNLHGKRDLIPGQTAVIRLRADKAGAYRGQCAEFCGFEHALMSFDVTAEDPNAFASWQTAQQHSAADPQSAQQERGKHLFLSATCASCHTIQGTPAAATTGPDLTHFASRDWLAAGAARNDAEHLRQWIADPQLLKPGANMPSHSFSNEDLDALVAYLENLQ